MATSVPPPASTPTTGVADMRQSYEKGTLLEADTPVTPYDLFTQWLADAVQFCTVTEPNAMTLATVDSSMRPHTRIVLLKGHAEHELRFYTNYHSDKGTQLAGNPHAALQFFWPELERQIRIEGTVQRLSAEDSQHYFSSRPRGSQLGAIASPQSQPVADRAFLDHALQQADTTHTGQDTLLCPAHWGGYGLRPSYWEFWQGRANRMHDRIRFQRNLTDTTWNKQRLAP